MTGQPGTPERGVWFGTTPSMGFSPRERAAPGEGQPRLLIMDVVGAFLRPLGCWVPVRALVGLMAELDVDEQATRSAMFRMRKRGLLVPEVRDGQRGYALSESALESLTESDRRIFSPIQRPPVEDGWTVVSFSVPEHERDKRHQLRSRLEWLGLGNLANGLWLAPRRLQPEIELTVEELGFESYVTLFEAHFRGFGELSDLVARCWDLDELGELYAEFVAATAAVAKRWSRRRVAGRQAYLDYVHTLHQWRKFPYLDPGLPRELLPRRWQGDRAEELFFGLRERLEGPAREYVADYVVG